MSWLYVLFRSDSCPICVYAYQPPNQKVFENLIPLSGSYFSDRWNRCPVQSLRTIRMCSGSSRTMACPASQLSAVSDNSASFSCCKGASQTLPNLRTIDTARYYMHKKFTGPHLIEFIWALVSTITEMGFDKVKVTSYPVAFFQSL